MPRPSLLRLKIQAANGAYQEGRSSSQLRTTPATRAGSSDTARRTEPISLSIFAACSEMRAVSVSPVIASGLFSEPD